LSPPAHCAHENILSTCFTMEGEWVPYPQAFLDDAPPSRMARKRIRGDSLGTVSRASPRPESGKIAVKVINRYADEVLRAFGV
jgi:hypothetical protein